MHMQYITLGGSERRLYTCGGFKVAAGIPVSAAAVGFSVTAGPDCFRLTAADGGIPVTVDAGGALLPVVVLALLTDVCRLVGVTAVAGRAVLSAAACLVD